MSTQRTQKRQNATAGPGAKRERASEPSFVPRTELGRRLWRIRQRIIAVEPNLLDWQGIENAVREGRGEATKEA